MISIKRRLVRQLRSVFKHAFGRVTRGDTGPLICFHAGPTSLGLTAAGVDGVSKWWRRAAGFGGAGLLWVSQVTEVVSRKRSKGSERPG